jgi:hypothetical protein
MNKRNFWILWVTMIVLACFSDAGAQIRYKIVDLGAPKNDNFSMVMSINNQGWTEVMAGNEAPGQIDFVPAQLLNGRVLIQNVDGFSLDLKTLGGPNSWDNWGEINELGQVVGFSETAVPDPNGEDICGFGTHLTCLPFLWQFNHMIALPTLGGNNGEASAINNRGQIVGMAENGAVDSTCPPDRMNNRIQLPVLWEHGKTEALPTVDGDPDGFAFWINDRGQAAGYSGTCTTALHAISWENGIASPLPDLGNNGQAWGISEQGQIVGTVGSADGQTQTGAIWQNGKLTAVLRVLPGDLGGIAFDSNSKVVVGAEWDSAFFWAHGFVYKDGVMTDLNAMIPASSNLFVTFPAKINERGEIGGMGIVLSGPDKGDMHAFVAIPVRESIGRTVADDWPTRPISNSPASASNRLLRLNRSGAACH